MKLSNAIKTLEKAGAVKIGGEKWSQEWRIGSRIVRLHLSDGNGCSGPDRMPSDVSTINVRRAGDEDRLIEDYFAGSYFPSLAQAVRYAKS